VLIRLRDITPADLPAGALERKETVRTLLAGCRGEEMPLGIFFSDYFEAR
jgi:hypothetical protein